jgi:hypothetical protein
MIIGYMIYNNILKILNALKTLSLRYHHKNDELTD